MTEMLKINGIDIPHRVVHMPADGSCMFHSLSYLIYGNIRMTRLVRSTIVSHVVSNWERFKVLTYAENGDNFTSRDRYQDAMNRSGTYGSTCELVAAGEIYPFQFQVFYRSLMLHSFGTEGRPVRKLRFMGSLNSGHFDVYEVDNRVMQFKRGRY